MDTIELPIGHNAPPSIVEALRDRLDLEHGAMLSRRDALLAGVARVPEVIEDDAACGKVGDFVKQITGTMKDADGTRVKVKEPYLEAGRAVDGFFKNISDPLDRGRKTLLARVTVYERAKADRERRAREEEARLQREEADRLRRAAEDAAAALRTEEQLPEALAAETAATQAAADATTAQRAAEVKPAELSRIRGDYGSVSSLRTFWDFADLDREALDLETLRTHLPLDAMEKAVRSFVKAGGRDLRGVRIFENTSAVIR